MNEKKHRVGWAIVITFIVTAVVVGIFTFALTIALTSTDQEETLTDEMNSVKALINQTYYKEVDDDVLMDGAIHGMVDALDDPYSVYYDQAERTEIKKDQAGE